MRCFVGIELPSQIRKEVKRIQEELREVELDAKWVEFENLHITLKFLGEVGEGKLSKIKEVISNLSFLFKPFTVGISKIGAFPKVIRPRVLWIGVEPFDNLIKIIEYLEEEFSKLGFPREKRELHPHITLARVRSLKNTSRLKEKVESSKLEKKQWQIDSVILFKSILTPRGPIYEEIFKRSLTP